MKKLAVLFSISFLGCCIMNTSLQAQSLKDLFNKDNVEKIVDAVTGNKQTLDLEGTWRYSESACEFKSDDLLKKAGGKLAANAIENKLDEYYAMAGITPENFSYIFNNDSTFTTVYGKRKFSGSYAYDKEKQEITFVYFKLLRSSAMLKKSGSRISLLFDADKLLKLISVLSSLTSSATLKTIGSLAEGYDGLLIGFQLDKIK